MSEPINPEQTIAMQVPVMASKLTKEELGAMYLAVFFSNSRPQNCLGYEKIKSLFTEKDGTDMHELTRTAFINYCAARL